jgi:hypothetical protein
MLTEEPGYRYDTHQDAHNKENSKTYEMNLTNHDTEECCLRAPKSNSKSYFQQKYVLSENRWRNAVFCTGKFRDRENYDLDILTEF